MWDILLVYPTHCGHALTWKILTQDTNKVIYRSQVRPFSMHDPNLCADLLCGEDDPPPLFVLLLSSHAMFQRMGRQNKPPLQILHPLLPVFNPEDLVGRTFLLDKQEYGQRFRARIVQLVEDHESSVENNPACLKFVCSVNDNQAEEILTYNQLLDYISSDENSDIVWKFQHIISHHGPLKPDHCDYKGSSYNVMIEWENGEVTAEPLQVIASDDPVTCAIYAKENNLLDLPGWKRFKPLAKCQKKFTQLINQAKLCSFNTAPRYKYGFEVPCSYTHAIRLDEQSKTTCWNDAVALELQQIDEYQTFKDYGHHIKFKPPDGYKKIRVHLIFDIKHDGRHRARLVADGHLTDIPLDSVYTGVVSLQGFRLVPVCQVCRFLLKT